MSTTSEDAPEEYTMKSGEKELIFPVSWGHIAAKTWNDSTGIPVLLLHGILDNAGAWEQLIPLLPKCYYFVAIDFPGHGKSSHFPLGVPVKFFDFVLAIEYVVDQLNWQNFIYIGHSFGGYVGFFYCAIFPERVVRFLSLDAGIYLYTNVECADHIIGTYHGIKKLERRMKSSKPLQYSFEEALNRISVAHDEPLNEQAARMLAKRCLIKSSEGYKFSIDQRLKIYEHSRMGAEQCLAMLKRIQCPVWIMVGDQSLIASNEDWGRFQYIMMMLKKTLKEYRFVVIEGNHNATLNHPARVSKTVNEFMLNTKSQL